MLKGSLKDRVNKIVEEKKVAKEIILNKEIVLQEFDLMKFDLDKVTNEYLIEQTLKIKEITVKAHTDLGKIFYETQKKLSMNKNGCFEEWYVTIGFKKQSVYNYINRYLFLVNNMDKKSLIESLPLKLIYQISNPNCPSEIVEMVLNGDIKNYKEYLQLKEPIKEEGTVEIINKYSNELDLYVYQERIGEKLSNKIECLNEEKKRKIIGLYKKIEEILK